MYDQNLFCFGGLSIEGVQKLLQKLNPQKACGPDQIPARILRDLADVIAPPLTLIFQKSLDEGNIPNDWRTANVTAIFKKGERYKASNYRPVSLTCSVAQKSLDPSLCGISDTVVIKFLQESFMWYSIKSF
jgi:hypothetical protein